MIPGWSKPPRLHFARRARPRANSQSLAIWAALQVAALPLEPSPLTRLSPKIDRFLTGQIRPKSFGHTHFRSPPPKNSDRSHVIRGSFFAAPPIRQFIFHYSISAHASTKPETNSCSPPKNAPKPGPFTGHTRTASHRIRTRNGPETVQFSSLYPSVSLET